MWIQIVYRSLRLQANRHSNVKSDTETFNRISVPCLFVCVVLCCEKENEKTMGFFFGGVGKRTYKLGTHAKRTFFLVRHSYSSSSICLSQKWCLCVVFKSPMWWCESRVFFSRGVCVLENYSNSCVSCLVLWFLLQVEKKTCETDVVNRIKVWCISRCILCIIYSNLDMNRQCSKVCCCVRELSRSRRL